MTDQPRRMSGIDDIYRLLAGDPAPGIFALDGPRSFTFDGPDVEILMDLLACLCEFLATPEGAAQFDRYMDTVRPAVPCTCGHPENHLAVLQDHGRQTAEKLRRLLAGDQ